MNELNYASMEAAKRLQDAGIVIETEADWHHVVNGDWYLLPHRSVKSNEFDKVLPAAQFAEVWRELPGEFQGADIEVGRRIDGLTFAGYHTPPDYEDDFGDDIISFSSTNPTDALINLLIWVRKEK